MLRVVMPHTLPDPVDQGKMLLSTPEKSSEFNAIALCAYDLRSWIFRVISPASCRFSQVAFPSTPIHCSLPISPKPYFLYLLTPDLLSTSSNTPLSSYLRQPQHSIYSTSTSNQFQTHESIMPRHQQQLRSCLQRLHRQGTNSEGYARTG